MMKISNIIQKITRVVMISFILLLPLGQIAAAQSLSPDDVNSIYGDTIWYKPGGSLAGGACSSTTLIGGDNAGKVFNFLTGKGLPEVSAAGIIGNLEQESGQGIDPTTEQQAGAWEDMSDNSGYGVGIAQWDGSRRPAMIKSIESTGLTLQDLKTASDNNLSAQLDYLWFDLTTNYPGTYSQMKSETDVTQATIDFLKGFEGAGIPNTSGRIDNAKKALVLYGSSSSGTPAAGSCSNTSSGSSIVQIALAEVGTHETNGDNDSATCKYQGPGCGPTTGEEWCADFISWVYKQAGVPFTGGLDGGWRIPGAAAVADWFKTNGIWISNPGSPVPVNDPRAPQPGDVVYYPDNGGHVNIVVSYDGKTVTIVGGNQSDSVNSEAYDVFGTAAGWGRLK